MNSQREFIEAIKTISRDRNRPYDTPATVLRVEDDTVWVHIDGGVDETPVRKTINCEQGETVQVRISNGSAFLVGNASAPPTDDKTANVAHFVAEQADVKATDANDKATEAKKTVEVLEVEVEGKVDSGDSNIQSLSSTMYQNANGVNIFNDTLAAGDSYAHIDGDEFCIREVTSAGVIDDTNDPVIASFGAEVSIASLGGPYDLDNYLKMSSDGIKLGAKEKHTPYVDTGWQIDGEKIKTYGGIYGLNNIEINAATGKINLNYSHSAMSPGSTQIEIGKAHFEDSLDEFGTFLLITEINGCNIDCVNQSRQIVIITPTGGEEPVYSETKIDGGIIKVTEPIIDFYNRKITPTIIESTTISTSTTSYTFTCDAITADSTVEVFDEIDGFEYLTCSVSAGSCTITFPAQSTSHKIKLHVW